MENGDGEEGLARQVRVLCWLCWAGICEVLEWGSSSPPSRASTFKLLPVDGAPWWLEQLLQPSYVRWMKPFFSSGVSAVVSSIGQGVLQRVFHHVKSPTAPVPPGPLQLHLMLFYVSYASPPPPNSCVTTQRPCRLWPFFPWCWTFPVSLLHTGWLRLVWVHKAFPSQQL